MNTTYIRDSALKVIGFIQTDGQGSSSPTRAGMVGIYNPQLDKTFDSRLRVYGNGNQLTALVGVAMTIDSLSSRHSCMTAP